MRLAETVLRWLITIADAITAAAGTVAAWLNPILVGLIMVDVLARYFLEDTAVWVAELEWHFFALIFLLGGAYTMKEDGHVRVDVLFQKLSPSGQKMVNLLGHTLLLIPLCLFMIPPAWDYFLNSWGMREASGDPGGIPALYVIKAAIPLAFVLLLIQAGVEILASIRYILFPERSEATAS